MIISNVPTDAWLIFGIAILSHASFQLLDRISFEIKSDQMCDQINYVMLLCQAVQTTGTPSLYVCVLCLHQFGLLTWTSVFHVDVFMFQVTEAITCL